MPADPLTLPGDIPGLLRRGSPVVLDGTSTGWTYIGACAVDGGDSLVADEDVVIPAWRRGLDLDLSDPTGQAHAAWWLRERLLADPDQYSHLRHTSRHARLQAMKGRATRAECADLIGFVLHVAQLEAPDAD